MWDGYLGQVNTATLGVELSLPEARPIRTVPYRSSSKAKEAENEKFEKILAIKVIEPEKTGWSLPIVFFRKKDKAYYFA